MEAQMTQTKSNVPMTMPQDWGASDITNDQIEITKIKLYQSSSEDVKMDKYKAGELVNKTSGLAIGGKGKPIEVIFCANTAFWITYEKDANGKSNFKEVFPLTAANVGLARVEGNIKRVPVWQFIALPANDPNGIPWIIPFMGSSFKHAKKLLAVIKNSKGSMGSYTYLLDTVMEKWQDNSYFVFSFKQGRKTTKEEELCAYSVWKDSEKAKAAAIDSFDTDDEGAAH